MKSVDLPATCSWTQAPTRREWHEYLWSSVRSVMPYTSLARDRRQVVMPVEARS